MNIAVIKLSGKSIEQFMQIEFQKSLVDSLIAKGKKVVIVHGAGKQISEWADALGHQSEFINGQRVTDQKMMDIVVAVQGGIINKKIISSMNANGYHAVGLSGIDGNLFSVDIIDEKLGFVGKPKIKGSANYIFKMLEHESIPVFSSICMNDAGEIINVNADLFTSELAAVLGAEEVYFFSDISGVIIDGKTVKFMEEQDIFDGIAQNKITGGMIPKLTSSLELVKKGISKVWIGNQLIINNNFETEGGTFVVRSSAKLAV